MKLSSLKHRISNADLECESEASREIQELYRQVKYDGSRLQLPSLNEASKIWLNMVKKKREAVTASVQHSLDLINPIDEEDIGAAWVVIKSIFENQKYDQRLTQFHQSVERLAGAYGKPLSENLYRLDVMNGAYTAAITNALRSTEKDIQLDLEEYCQARGVAMGFSSLLTDTVSIIKKNGTRFDGVKASVQKDNIFLQRADILVEPEDLVERKMSNGGTETFEVIDPGFHEQFHSIPAGYQMSVRKLGIPEAKQAAQTIINNLTGPNARVNFGSIDNSSNSANTTNIKIFEQLRAAISEALHEPESAILLTKLDELQNAVATPTYVSRYKEFMQAAANHMALISPFIPALTALIS